MWLQFSPKRQTAVHVHSTHTLITLTHTIHPCTLKRTDLQEFSRSILGRWQSRCSSIRSSNLGLCPVSEVSRLSWHAKAVWPIRPSLRAERRKTTLTVLQCQVSVQIAVHLARDNKEGEKSFTSERQRQKSQLSWMTVWEEIVFMPQLPSVSLTPDTSLVCKCLHLLPYSVYREGISSNLGQLKAN